MISLPYVHTYIHMCLQLIIPQRHKARHRQMVAQKNLEFAKYLRKHSYAPPDQKTTRTYSVRPS